MSSQNSVTFKDLNIYSRTYWGVVYNAGGYTFDNVDFTGSQLVYTASSMNSTVTFKNNVNATAVGSYTGPLDGTTRSSQGGDTQQILQFQGGTNQIIFDEGSNVTLTTTNSNVLEIDGGTTTITVKNGAVVSLDPHTKNSPETLYGIGTGAIARGVASNGTTNLNVEKGGTLNINLTKDSGDKYLSGALYLNSDATLNVNGNLNINSDGQSSFSRSDYVPVYINGNATINVNGGSFKATATNMGDSYKGPIVSSNGKSTISINHHGSFIVTGDGAQATAVQLASGSTFTSTQPAEFTITMPNGATAVKNGTINFKGVKTSENAQPIGEINVSYASNGTPTVNKIVSADKQTTIDVRNSLTSNKNTVNFIAAGEEVDLKDITFTKDADGNYIMSGNANTAAGDGAYVYISVNGTVHQVSTTNNQTLWTIGATGDPTPSNDPYTVETGSDGSFSVNLGKLNDSDQVSVYAAKDFVTSDTDKKTVSEWMTNSYRDQLNKLVKEAPTIEAGTNYTAADTNLKTAYTNAISAGSTLLNNTSATSAQLEAAVNTITSAKDALNGDKNITAAKEALQKAVDNKSTVEGTSKYYNATEALQNAYKDAITAGSNTLAETSPTLADLQKALTAITTAENNLNGKDTDKTALQNNVDSAVDVTNVNASETAKADYTTALNNAKSVLADTNATQTAVDAANTALTNAKTALDASELQTAKDALQQAVNAAPDTEKTAAYYNADSTKQTAYTDAITAGNTALNAQNPTVESLTDALNAINTAKNALDGKATDTSKLQAAIDNANTVEAGDDYKNASADVQKQYTDAVTAGQNLLNRTTPELTQAEVDAATKAITDAQTALTNSAALNTSKAALKAAVEEAPTVEKTSSAYYNGTEPTQTAYKTAVEDGQKVLDNADATVDQINSALNAINTAKNALDGKATDKSELKTLVDNSNDIKSSNNYTNADQTAQTAYDSAISDAQKVLSNDNATQAEVDNAITAINDANKNLNGDAKTEAANKAALEAAVKEAPTVQDTPAYYNGTDEAQKAYNDAITAGQGVLNNTNATADQVKDALDAITTAKSNLKGEATNTDALNTAITNANNAKQTDNYTDADQEKQDALTNAINAGQDILKKTNATQAEVDNAVKTINAAIDGLNGTTNLENAKTDATTAIDKALNAKTAEINQATNIDQDQKNNLITEATQAANDAKNAIKNATTTADVTTAKNTGVDNINKVAVPSLDSAKQAANKAVDTALDDQIDLINNADNINNDEKQDLINKAIDAANTAKENIDNTSTNDAAAKAGQDGVAEIEKIVPTSLDDAKSQANKAIDDALANKLKDIKAATDLTTNEKDALTQEANNAATTARANVANATTNDAATQAGQDGVKAIDAIEVPTESAVKQAAKNAVAKVVDEKNQVIDASNLTDEEKAALKKQVTDAQAAADNAIDAATTNTEVTSAQQTGIDNINKITVPSTSDAKTKATTDLNNAVDAAKKAIDQDTNLTEDERKAAKDQVDADAKTAQEAIDNAKTDADVTKATNDGQLNIDKTVANAAIDNAVAGKKAEISNAKDLSSDDVTALNNEVDQAAKDAKAAINSANTEDAVNEAQTTGVNTINAIDVATTAAKDKAKSDIDQAANDAKKAIDDNKDLTDDQKTAAKDQIDQDATKAKDNINNAKTDKDAADANNAGQLAIAKDGAKAAVQGALNKKLNEIDSASALTSDEKAKLTNDANTAATNANKTIDEATTPTEVTSAKDNGVKNIEDINVPTTSATKSAADKAIDEALANKQAEINKSTTLTDDEKADLNKQATDAANTAKQNIANAKTDSAVATAKDNGVAAIDGIKVPANSTAKDQAKTNITDAADKAKQAIDQDNNLTNDQKQAAKDQIDTDAKNAQDVIDNAKTDTDVNNAADNGKLAIDKTVANAAIDNAVAGKVKDVKSLLTTDEQKTLTDLIKETGENAKQNIANATTPAEVTTAQDNGVKAVNDIKIPTNSSTRDAANAAIDQALQNKTNEINNATNITDQEKQDLIDKATEAANIAKDNIKNATTDGEVTTAETNGEKAIVDVTIPGLSDIKKESTDLINKTLDKKKDEINNASNLSNDEKQQLINDATKAATYAINNINNAKTNDDAKKAADTGAQHIENISIPSLDGAKKDANQAIDDALKSKTNEINNASNLSDQEKQDLVKKATDAANTAKDNINRATTNDAVKDAENTGVNNIKGITFTNLDDAKKAANNAIDEALSTKTNEINNASNLSDQEKQDLINKATDVAKTAKDNITKATTNDAVNDAQNKGIEDIANVTVPSLNEAKQNAINAIKQVREAKNKQISDAKNLNADQQKNLTDQINKIANDAIAKINDLATSTNDGVKSVRDNAIDQITNLFIPTLDGAKTGANNSIDAAKKAKIDEINNAKNLSDQEKQDLTNKVNQAAADATKAIKDATTNDAVKDAETKGLKDINDITVPSLADKQQAAIEALNSARDAKLNSIDNASGLTDSDKQSLKDKVQAEYSKAVNNINQATTDEDVANAEKAGVDAINAIEIKGSSSIDNGSGTSDNNGNSGSDTTNPTTDNNSANKSTDNKKNDNSSKELENAKKSAIDAIDNALAKKQKEIKQSNLSDAQKTKLINKANTVAEAAREAVENATDAAAAKAASQSGAKAIDEITVAAKANKAPEATKRRYRHGAHGADAAASLAETENRKAGSSIASSIKGENKAKAELPQTDAKKDNISVMGAVLTGLAGAVALFGIARKRRNK